jgi:hypothetical protein
LMMKSLMWSSVANVVGRLNCFFPEKWRKTGVVERSTHGLVEMSILMLGDVVLSWSPGSGKLSPNSM